MTIELLVSMMAVEAIRQGLDVSELGITLGWDGRYHAGPSFPIILAFCMDDVSGGRRLSSLEHISGIVCWAWRAVSCNRKRVVMTEYDSGWVFNLYTTL